MDADEKVRIRKVIPALISAPLPKPTPPKFDSSSTTYSTIIHNFQGIPFSSVQLLKELLGKRVAEELSLTCCLHEERRSGEQAAMVRHANLDRLGAVIFILCQAKPHLSTH